MREARGGAQFYIRKAFTHAAQYVSLQAEVFGYDQEYIKLQVLQLEDAHDSNEYCVSCFLLFVNVHKLQIVYTLFIRRTPSSMRALSEILDAFHFALFAPGDVVTCNLYYNNT